MSAANRRPSVEARVDRFLAKRDDPFILAEAIQAVTPASGRAPARSTVARSLADSESLFQHPTDEELYIPRAPFFQGARFLIRPTAHELELGVLFPGHRFMPFISSSVFPAEAQLKWRSGKKIALRSLSCLMKNVMVYHSFYGLEGSLRYFLCDDRRNMDSLNTGPPTDRTAIHLNVFDLQDIYAATAFKEGDYFLCVVTDWRKARLSLTHFSEAKGAEAEERKKLWREHFVDALMEVFDTLGTMATVEEQLAHAFFLGEAYLSRVPGGHMGAILENSDIRIQDSFPAATLRPADDDRHFVPPTQPSAPTGTTESLAEMLDDIGVSLNPAEIRAYMRDQLYRETDSFDELTARCFRGRETVFFDEAQEKAFYRALRTMWTAVKKDYNLFADHLIGDARGKLLEVNDTILAHLRKLDRAGVAPEDMPAELCLELGHLSAIVAQSLELLDEPVTSKQEIENFSRTVDQLLGPAEHLVEQILANLRHRGIDL